MARTKSTVELPNGENVTVTAVPDKPKAISYTKAQLLTAKRYDSKRDALYVVLESDEKYTHQQVEALLNQFYEGGNK